MQLDKFEAYYLESQLFFWRSCRKLPESFSILTALKHIIGTYISEIWRQQPLPSLLDFPSFIEILEFQSLIAIRYFDSFILTLS